jgi:hypothetical protein
MLLAKHLLTKELYNNALKEGVTVFLYNEINFSPKPIDGITLFNCTTERVPSTWFTWKKNEEIFESFKIKFPSLFKWNQYDLTLAIQKAIFWSNMRTGYLYYSKDKYFKNESMHYLSDKFQPISPLKTTLKYVKNIKLKSQINFEYQINKNSKIGILIEDEFQLSLYKYILVQLKSNENAVVFVLHSELIKMVENLGIPIHRIFLIKHNLNHDFQFPLVNLFKIKNQEWFIFNEIINTWKEINYWVSISEQMFSKGIGKLLINEGENGTKGAVIGEIMKVNNIFTYNTMNGMKSGQVQDAFVNFNYWFVWGEGMKKMLIDKCYLPEKMLLNAGHLMEDEIAHYEYQNSFSELNLVDKTIISLFSVRGKREEKIDAFQYLYQLAEQNPQIQLLIRKHPSEKDEDFIKPTKILNNVMWVNFDFSNSKQTLCDQLLLSDLSICFGSTVALESKWFGVPCITFEKRDESLIYLTDNETIFHVKDLEQMVQKCTELLSIGKNKKPKLNKVANYIVETLLN